MEKTLVIMASLTLPFSALCETGNERGADQESVQQVSETQFDAQEFEVFITDIVSKYYLYDSDHIIDQSSFEQLVTKCGTLLKMVARFLLLYDKDPRVVGSLAAEGKAYLDTWVKDHSQAQLKSGLNHITTMMYDVDKQIQAASDDNKDLTIKRYGLYCIMAYLAQYKETNLDYEDEDTFFPRMPRRFIQPVVRKIDPKPPVSSVVETPVKETVSTPPSEPSRLKSAESFLEFIGRGDPGDVLM